VILAEGDGGVFDIAIIGAGPAGAMLARLIGRRYRVLLVERRRLDEPERFALRKCCGGLLAPDAQAMLSRLGLGVPKDVLQGPQLFVVRAIDVPRRLERYYQRHYINMDRLRFERWLLSMVPPEVDVRLGCRLTAWTAGHGRFTLRLRRDGRSHEETARMVVGADGATSKVRALLANRRKAPRRYVAIQEWAETSEPTPYFSSVFDPEITDYYCWTIPKDSHLVIGAALHPRAQTLQRFDLLKRRLREYGLRFGRPVSRESAFILRPLAPTQVWTGADGIALLGEAAGWITPSSAEGLSYALRSACALADAVHPGLRGFERRYRRATTALRRNIVFKGLKSRVVFNPTWRRAIMGLGVGAISLYAPTGAAGCRADPGPDGSETPRSGAPLSAGARADTEGSAPE
jgi:flavin-dependent dehydrogenase